MEHSLTIQNWQCVARMSFILRMVRLVVKIRHIIPSLRHAALIICTQLTVDIAVDTKCMTLKRKFAAKGLSYKMSDRVTSVV